MKKIFLLTVGLGFALHTQAQITFEQGSWADVKAKAKKENKMIFVDAYTTWCGPCKVMSKNTFTDKSVGEYYNANFVNYKFDMEKGEGPAFANEFSIQAYPTLLYFTSAGEVAYRTEGAQNATQFLSTGTDVKEGKIIPTPEVVEAEEVKDWSSLNNKAWAAYESETNPAKLEEAAKWALESVEMEQNFFNTDTYAHLLYKLGRKKEAQKWALTSIELGKRAGEDISGTEALLKKIEKGQ